MQGGKGKRQFGQTPVNPVTLMKKHSMGEKEALIEGLREEERQEEREEKGG